VKPDQIIVKRFEELAQKAEAVAGTRRPATLGNLFVVDEGKYYEWAVSALGLIERVFGPDSAVFDNFRRLHGAFKGYDSEFYKIRGVFQAAKEDYEGGYLVKMRGLVYAEALDSDLDQASELLAAGYKDPACVVAGVVLETALKELCKKNGVPIAKLDKMNADIAKLGIYNVGMQKQITAWADRRNNAAHGNWKAYGTADVEDMIKGVTRFIAEYL
jgi:hypothetical protein